MNKVSKLKKPLSERVDAHFEYYEPLRQIGHGGAEMIHKVTVTENDKVEPAQDFDGPYITKYRNDDPQKEASEKKYAYISIKDLKNPKLREALMKKDEKRIQFEEQAEEKLNNGIAKVLSSMTKEERKVLKNHIFHKKGDVYNLLGRVDKKQDMTV